MNALHVRALVAAAIALPGPAHAEADEWALSLGPGLRGLVASDADGDTSLAPLAFARLRYGLDDFFQLGVTLDVGVALPTDGGDPLPVTATMLELLYTVDIVTWVPFVTLGVGVLVSAKEETTIDGDVVATQTTLAADLVASLGGGVEYRPARDWALGLSGRWEPVITRWDTLDAFSFALFYTLFFE